MTDRESLVRAVVADPDNPVPRLVFADYLDEAGDHDWAELIRLQNGYFKHWTNLDEMRQREAELVAAVMAKYPEPPGLRLGPPVRGFPDRAMFVTDYNAAADDPDDLPPDPRTVAALADYPITRFDFTDGHPFWLADQGWLRRAVVLNLSYCVLSDAERNRFMAGTDPARLRALIWHAAGLGDEEAAALAAAPALAGLTELSLAENFIAEAGCDALIRSPHLRRLTFLDLSGNPVGRAAERLESRFGPALVLA